MFSTGTLNFLAAIAILLLCALLPGCGGEDEGTAAGSEPLTKPQFVKQSNQICSDGNKQKESDMRQAAKESGKGLFDASPAELEKLFVDVVLPVYAETISKLEGLTPPAGDAATVEKFVTGFRVALREAEANPHELLNGNPFASSTERAVAYGLENCRL